MAWFAARNGFGEHQCPVRFRIGWRDERAVVLAARCATISRRFENASRYSRAARPSAPASRSARCATAARKSPNGSSGIPPHLAEVMPPRSRAAASVRCTRPVRRRSARPRHRQPRWRRTAVVDGLLESVAVADAPEVRQQHAPVPPSSLRSRVAVRPSLRVLTQHRARVPPPRPCTRRRQQPAGLTGGTGLYDAAECPGRDSTSPDAGRSFPLSPKPTDPSLGQRGGEPSRATAP